MVLLVAIQPYCSNSTWVVEEILAYIDRVRSTNCREFPLNFADPLTSLDLLIIPITFHVTYLPLNFELKGISFTFRSIKITYSNLFWLKA